MGGFFQVITFTGSATETGREFKSHAIIGQNSSDKSNMIRAIVTIFRETFISLVNQLDLAQPLQTTHSLVQQKILLIR